MNSHDQQWDKCPPGELQRMVADIHESRRRRRMQAATSVLAAVLLVAAGGWLGAQVLGLTLRGEAGPRYGDIACQRVQELLADYGHGVLSAALEEKIAAHLEQCPHCGEMHRRMQRRRQSPETNAAAPSQRPRAFGQQPLLTAGLQLRENSLDR